MTGDIVFEDVACDLCGSASHTKVLDSADHRVGFAGLFTIVRCNDCGLYFINPRPTELSIGSYYPDNYYAFGNAEPLKRSGLRRKIRQLIRGNRIVNAGARLVPPLRNMTRDPWLEHDIDTWHAPGKILDVGCGSGGYLDLMADAGWQTYGIEPGRNAAEEARSKGHIIACQSATERLPETLSGTLFDLIHMSHSLEHVHSPARALQTLRGLLRPDTGYIVIEVPNIDSVFTRLFHEYSPAFDPPRHLFMFSPETLTSLLNKSGFTILKLRHISRPAQFTASLQLVMDTLGGRWDTEAGKKIGGDPAFLATLSALNKYADDRHMGGAIRIVARRGPGPAG